MDLGDEVMGSENCLSHSRDGRVRPRPLVVFKPRDDSGTRVGKSDPNEVCQWCLKAFPS